MELRVPYANAFAYDVSGIRHCDWKRYSKNKFSDEHHSEDIREIRKATTGRKLFFSPKYSSNSLFYSSTSSSTFDQSASSHVLSAQKKKKKKAMFVSFRGSGSRMAELYAGGSRRSFQSAVLCLFFPLNLLESGSGPCCG